MSFYFPKSIEHVKKGYAENGPLENIISVCLPISGGASTCRICEKSRDDLSTTLGNTNLVGVDFRNTSWSELPYFLSTMATNFLLFPRGLAIFAKPYIPGCMLSNVNAFGLTVDAVDVEVDAEYDPAAPTPKKVESGACGIYYNH